MRENKLVNEMDKEQLKKLMSLVRRERRKVNSMLYGEYNLTQTLSLKHLTQTMEVILDVLNTMLSEGE